MSAGVSAQHSRMAAWVRRCRARRCIRSAWRMGCPLPGNAGRWRAWGKGVRATIVNGEPIVLNGELTGRLPGQVVSPD